MAIAAAREILDHITPVCNRIIIAGSLRRMKQDVGDIEILYIPRTEIRQIDLIETAPVSLADEAIEKLLAQNIITKRLSVSGHPSWGEKNKLATHHSGVPVDFFATTESAWHNYLVCRTGPAASNTRIATAAQQMGYQWKPYSTGFIRLSDGKAFPMHSEQAVFDFVKLPYAEPRDRQ
jgi:DNA polymerase/3'-5' exonuclease PolX